MVFYKDLEKIIFDDTKDADELIILSGYIGLEPIQQTSELPYTTKIIYGMYEDSGISEVLHDSVVRINKTLAKTEVLYSLSAVHSKCYIWRKDNEIQEALLGSANFTMPGLNTPEREILSDVSKDSFKVLNEYVNKIIQNSVNCCNIEKSKLKIMSYIRPKFGIEENDLSFEKCDATLLGQGNKVPEHSGLNWGLANAHVSEGDAYITITKKMIEDYSFLFPPKQMTITKASDEGKENRQNDYIEILWDDGTLMKGLLEGNQDIDGVLYPNKISSFPKKNILGKYLRNRLGVDLNHMITTDDLHKYGRTYITISLIGEGVYSMDFSPIDLYSNEKDYSLKVADKHDEYVTKTLKKKY